MSFRRVVFSFLAAALSGATAARAQNQPDYEKPPINYSAATPNDAIAQLQQRLTRGALVFHDNERETLAAVLRELAIPIESQVLVFSKTSLQRGRIRPDQPRALYFSDSVYVGWVPGGLIEVAALDPLLGPVFYSFDPRARSAAERMFARDSDCLRCHGGTFVREIPGVFARSVVPSETGEPLLRHGTEVVDDTTPFERRWGGWYVTGYTGKTDHRGNRFATEHGEALVFSAPDDARPADVASFCDTSRYLAATSDVVALLVFEHQLTVHNALTHAGQSCRKMLEYQRGLQTALKDPLTDEPSYDSVKSVFASAVENVVDRLLFRDAAPLPAQLGGRAEFQRTFLSDTTPGRALKTLRLRGRLFALRCSYLVYSDMFAGLLPQLKTRIFARLHDALTSDDPKSRYAYLERDERQQIYEVLRATHPDAQAWPAHVKK